MNQNKRKKSKPSVLKNKLFQFILAIVMIAIIGTGISYFITTVILKATNHYEEGDLWAVRSEEAASDEEQTLKETENQDQEEIEVNQEDKTLSFNQNTVHFLQVSSLTNEDSAKNAVNVFKNEGISTAYQKTGESYKMYAFAGSDLDELKQFRENFVFKYPKYADSFIVSHDYTWETTQLLLPEDSTLEVGDFNESLNHLVDTVLEGQSTGDIDEAEIQSIYDQIHSLNDLIYQASENQEVAFAKKWATLDEMVKNLMDRKASAVEYNGRLLNWLIDNTF